MTLNERSVHASNFEHVSLLLTSHDRHTTDASRAHYNAASLDAELSRGPAAIEELVALAALAVLPEAMGPRRLSASLSNCP